jgi:hypothetical protein
VAVDGRTSERQGAPFLWWGAHHGPTRAHGGSLPLQVSHGPESLPHTPEIRDELLHIEGVWR